MKNYVKQYFDIPLLILWLKTVERKAIITMIRHIVIAILTKKVYSQMKLKFMVFPILYNIIYTILFTYFFYYLKGISFVFTV